MIEFIVSLDLPRTRFNYFYLLNPACLVSAGLEIDHIVFIHGQDEKWSEPDWKSESRRLQRCRKQTENVQETIHT